MTETVEEEVPAFSKKNDLNIDDIMKDESLPSESELRLKLMQRVRFALLKKHLNDSDDPKMLARLEALMNSIDKQDLTLMRLAQDKEEGEAQREIAMEIFNRMVKAGIQPGEALTEELDIDESGIELLPDELIQGDDTLDSVI